MGVYFKTSLGVAGRIFRGNKYFGVLNRPLKRLKYFETTVNVKHRQAWSADSPKGSVLFYKTATDFD
jgi:hypothetical protein